MDIAGRFAREQSGNCKLIIQLSVASINHSNLFTPQKELCISVILFTSQLIEHSFSKHVYDSMEVNTLLNAFQIHITTTTLFSASYYSPLLDRYANRFGSS